MEDLKKLIYKNQQQLASIEEKIDKIRRYILWQRIFSILKLVIILVPLIIALVYAVPYMKEGLKAYQEALGAVNSLTGGIESSGVSESMIQQFLK
ncbi:hypothetical protein HQ571_01715 [Candidatus Kuenenbacteria bacterium]|nr:hypothetical protein [Candidatus Kuenenbacteria bacterium]